MGELEEKIKKELLKSGFPLEIFCKRCLLQNKWGIESPGQMVFGDEKRKEIDALGSFQEDLGKNTTIFYTLHVECKKSRDNPWVFFKEDFPFSHLLIEHENILLRDPIELVHNLKDLHFHRTPFSSIYTMAFQCKSNQIYDAIMNLLSSYQFRREFFGKHRRAKKPKFSIIDVDFLTILFDGKLYIATIEEDNNINLAEENHVIYYHCEVEYPRFRHYNIEIVSRDYFPNYLNILNKDREVISKFCKQEIQKQ